jgi:hypothetical protein
MNTFNTIEDVSTFSFQSEDVNGPFEVVITKDTMPQLTIRMMIDNFPDEAFVNLNGLELIAIRDMLNSVITLNKWEK